MSRRPAIFVFVATTIVLAVLVLFVFFHWSQKRRTPFAGDSCTVARLYLNEASDFSNRYRYNDAYNAADLGLRANRTCTEAEQNLINEGFLLSTKSIAENVLSRGNSKFDLDRAIHDLERCRKNEPTLGRAQSDMCEKQIESDEQTKRNEAQTHITLP